MNADDGNHLPVLAVSWQRALSRNCGNVRTDAHAPPTEPNFSPPSIQQIIRIRLYFRNIILLHSQVQFRLALTLLHVPAQRLGVTQPTQPTSHSPTNLKLVQFIAELDPSRDRCDECGLGRAGARRGYRVCCHIILPTTATSTTLDYRAMARRAAVVDTRNTPAGIAAAHVFGL